MGNVHVGYVRGRFYTGNQNVAIGTKAMASKPEPEPKRKITPNNRPSVFSVYDK